MDLNQAPSYHFETNPSNSSTKGCDETVKLSPLSCLIPKALFTRFSTCVITSAGTGSDTSSPVSGLITLRSLIKIAASILVIRFDEFRTVS